MTHRFEWLAPVLVVNAVFAAFLVAQAAVIFGGHDYLQRTTGLTYAEYVHQGFGQLTVATALTLLVIWAAARKVPARQPRRPCSGCGRRSGLLCVQTLVVVASALHRMHLYQDAYGFTQLRLLVDVFEGWLGLLVLGVLAAASRLRGAWLPRFALLSGVVALLGTRRHQPRRVDRPAQPGSVRRDRSASTGPTSGACRTTRSRRWPPCPRTSVAVRSPSQTDAVGRLAGVEPRPSPRCR